MASPVILGLGNPLLDLSAVVPLEFIQKHNAQLGQSILAAPCHLPMFAELKKNFPVREIPGGACQNAIRAAQFVLREPGATAFVGCVGNDIFGERQKELIEQNGTKALYQIHPTMQTGTCAALVHNVERALVANIGAAGHLDFAHMQRAEVQSAIESARIMYVEGFFLMVCMPAIELLASRCLEATRTGRRKIFCLNLSAAFVVECNYKELESLLPSVDYLFANEDEARIFARKFGWEDCADDVMAIAARAAALPKHDPTHPRTVVFTQGTSPTCAAVAPSADTLARTLSVPIQLVPREELRDTNGAGDSFVGGFLAALSQGKTLEECIAAGHALAAIKVRHEGCVWE